MLRIFARPSRLRARGGSALGGHPPHPAWWYSLTASLQPRVRRRPGGEADQAGLFKGPPASEPRPSERRRSRRFCNLDTPLAFANPDFVGSDSKSRTHRIRTQSRDLAWCASPDANAGIRRRPRTRVRQPVPLAIPRPSTRAAREPAPRAARNPATVNPHRPRTRAAREPAPRGRSQSRVRQPVPPANPRPAPPAIPRPSTRTAREPAPPMNRAAHEPAPPMNPRRSQSRDRQPAPPANPRRPRTRRASRRRSLPSAWLRRSPRRRASWRRRVSTCQLSRRQPGSWCPS